MRRQLDDESAANAALCERLDTLQRRKEYGGPPTAQAAAAAYRAKGLENLLALRDKQLISVLAQSLVAWFTSAFAASRSEVPALVMT